MNLTKFLFLLGINILVFYAVGCRAAEFTTETTDRGVAVKLDGKVFTEYLIKSGNKPILWPIIGPTGKAMTRPYPLEDSPDHTTDHPHHRSMWFTHGDVNGVDFWSDRPNTGSTVHKGFSEVSGGERAKIVANNDWLDQNGKKICEDQRTIICLSNGDDRIIDFDIAVKAGDAPVIFGDTKEGTFGIRVADSIRVDAKHGGEIINSNGQKDDEAWGKPANWVDYHGPIDGETLGIAILNHPSSYGFPTHWHVRTYGLFAANPFGLHDFVAPASAHGSHTIPQGETMNLRYRVILHKGDEKQGHIAESFANYAKQP